MPGMHRRRVHPMAWADLPGGTFVLLDQSTGAVVGGDYLYEWTHDGYGARRSRPAHGVASVITPPSTVAALCAGYPVQIDDAAAQPHLLNIADDVSRAPEALHDETSSPG